MLNCIQGGRIILVEQVSVLFDVNVGMVICLAALNVEGRSLVVPLRLVRRQLGDQFDFLESCYLGVFFILHLFIKLVLHHFWVLGKYAEIMTVFLMLAVL